MLLHTSLIERRFLLSSIHILPLRFLSKWQRWPSSIHSTWSSTAQQIRSPMLNTRKSTLNVQRTVSVTPGRPPSRRRRQDSKNESSIRKKRNASFAKLTTGFCLSWLYSTSSPTLTVSQSRGRCYPFLHSDFCIGSNIANAKVAGMNAELGLTGRQYNMILTV